MNERLDSKIVRCGLNDHRRVKHSAFGEMRVEARKNKLEGLSPLNVSKSSWLRRDGEKKNNIIYVTPLPLSPVQFQYICYFNGRN